MSSKLTNGKQNTFPEMFFRALINSQREVLQSLHDNNSQKICHYLSATQIYEIAKPIFPNRTQFFEDLLSKPLSVPFIKSKACTSLINIFIFFRCNEAGVAFRFNSAITEHLLIGEANLCFEPKPQETL